MRKNAVFPWSPRLLVILLGLILPRLGWAQELAVPVKLRWNAAADSNVAGYAVYFGPAVTGRLQRVDVGPNLEVTLSNLYVGTTYRIYAVSYNAFALESIPSNELLYTPTVSAAPPAGQNGRLQITRLADGRLRLNTTATSGTVGAIQFAATPNPIYWQTLTNVTANRTGQIIALDAAAASVAQRFYRFVPGPQPLLLRITLTPPTNGMIRLEWLTPPGAVTQLQSAGSPNARIWTPRATLTADAEGRTEYWTPVSPTSEAQFYRVMMTTEPATYRERGAASGAPAG